MTAKWSPFEALSPHDVHALLKLRQTVFVLEQSSLYPDIDGKDPDALHYLVSDKLSGQLAGAIRLFAHPDDRMARIGRVVVAKHARGAGLGRCLMLAGLVKADSLVPGGSVHVSAQAHLEKLEQGGD